MPIREAEIMRLKDILRIATRLPVKLYLEFMSSKFTYLLFKYIRVE